MNSGLIDKSQELFNIFKNIIGNNNVYYQPPSSVTMEYPAIVYSRKDIENKFANNNVYMQSHAYQVTVIDKDPDSEIADKVSKLQKCVYVRHYTMDNLNHDVFTIFY